MVETILIARETCDARLVKKSMSQTTPPTTPITPKPKSRTVLYAIIIIILIVVGVGVYYLTKPPPGSTANVIVNDDGTCGANDPACNFTPLTYNGTLNTAVSWQNNGRVGHTITSCDTTNVPTPNSRECPTMNTAGLDTFNKNIGAGASVSFAVRNAGTYYYFCSIHPDMHGILGAK